MSNPYKIIFAGTPEFGLPCLDALYKENISLQAIYTQPDRPAGRGRTIQTSPIKNWGTLHDIPIYQPQNFKNQDTIDALKALQPDLMVVIAYGLILPKQVLQIPKFGCINVHASILPRWRGASPIQHAILHGDNQTGITIMQMDVGMDTGDIYEIATTEISENDNAETLHDKLAQLAIKPLLNTLKNIIKQNNTKVTKQDDSLATYAPKITKDDAKINWQQDAIKIEYQIRAFNPWPLAFTTANDTRFQILEAKAIDTRALRKLASDSNGAKRSTRSSCNPGEVLEVSKQGIIVSALHNALLIKKIKFPGKNAISISDYMNANNKVIQQGTMLK